MILNIANGWNNNEPHSDYLPHLKNEYIDFVAKISTNETMMKKLEKMDLNILNLLKKKLEIVERITIEENYKKFFTQRINDIKLLNSEVEKLLDNLNELIDQNSNLEQEYSQAFRDDIQFQKVKTN